MGPRDALPAGLLLVVLGLVVVVVGCFLPMAAVNSSLIELEGNTLIADGGDGWLYVLGVVATAILCWSWAHGSVSWVAILVFGGLGVLVAFAEGAYVSTGEIWTDGSGGVLETTPGAGVWAVGIGSLLVAAGAALLRGVRPPRARAPATPGERGAPAPGGAPARGSPSASGGPPAPGGAPASGGAPARGGARPGDASGAPAPQQAWLPPRAPGTPDPSPRPPAGAKPLWRRPENDPPLDREPPDRA